MVESLADRLGLAAAARKREERLGSVAAARKPTRDTGGTKTTETQERDTDHTRKRKVVFSAFSRENKFPFHIHTFLTQINDEILTTTCFFYRFWQVDKVDLPKP